MVEDKHENNKKQGEEGRGGGRKRGKDEVDEIIGACFPRLLASCTHFRVAGHFSSHPLTISSPSSSSSSSSPSFVRLFGTGSASSHKHSLLSVDIPLSSPVSSPFPSSLPLVTTKDIENAPYISWKEELFPEQFETVR